MRKQKEIGTRKGRKGGKGRKKKYSMRLYVTGATGRSMRAITNVRRLCEKYLPGEYDLTVVDVYQQPWLAREGQIIAAPTLVKAFPLPLRRLIGDMSNTRNLLAALEIRTKNSEEPDNEPPGSKQQK